MFERFGVELEYMLVDAETFDVRPVCDLVLRDQAGGEITGDVDVGAIGWSNELVNHVIELKTAEPVATLAGLAAHFQDSIRRIEALAARYGARLMPGGMHPWMDPARAQLWPHEYSEVYGTFDRIFGCRGHGWSNLQSAHLNLPFAGDEEFGRLHAAIRLLLPVLPALAASSPFIDGAVSGFEDTRLEVYRVNCARVPSVTGRVIPEAVSGEQEYRERILAPMYRDVAALDPAGVIQHEWLNARGAIARFERSAIEIRVLDVQECPQADVAIIALIVAVLRGLVEERWSGAARQRAWAMEPLEHMLLEAIRVGADASLAPGYGEMLGAPQARTAGELWRAVARGVAEELSGSGATAAEGIAALREGSLSRRMAALFTATDDLRALAREMCDCLRAGREMSGR